MCEEELRTVSARYWLRQLLSTFWDGDRKQGPFSSFFFYCILIFSSVIFSSFSNKNDDKLDDNFCFITVITDIIIKIIG